MEISTDALTYTELRASASGIITARNIEVGQVAQSAQSAYTLAEDGARDAVFDVYESVFLTPLEGDTITADAGLGSDGDGARAAARDLADRRSRRAARFGSRSRSRTPPAAMTLGSAVTGEGRSRAGRQDRAALERADIRPTNGPAVWVIDPKTHVGLAREHRGRNLRDRHRRRPPAVSQSANASSPTAAKCCGPAQIVTF